MNAQYVPPEEGGKKIILICFNQFVSNAPFLYPLKTTENPKGALGTNGLIC